MNTMEEGPPAPTTYKIDIQYADETTEEITVNEKEVFTWTTTPHPTPADQNTRKILCLLRLIQYLKENGGIKVEIIEQP